MRGNLMVRDRLVLWIVLVLGLAPAVMAYRLLTLNEALSSHQELVSTAATLQTDLDKSLKPSTNVVEALGWAFASQHDLDEDEFKSFMESAFPEGRAVKSVWWLPKVDAAGRAAWEAALKAERPDSPGIVDLTNGKDFKTAPAREVHADLTPGDDIVGDPRVGPDDVEAVGAVADARRPRHVGADEIALDRVVVGHAG